MTIEEAIQLAENGDIGAIISLGDYYMKQNTGEGISQAVEWYEKAAQKNVVYAILMTVLGKKILAYAGLQIASHGEFGTDFLLDDWNEVYDWAAKELECIKNNVPGSERIDVNEAIKNFEEASYYLALCCYWGNKYSMARDLVCDFEDVRAQILNGASCLQLAETNNEYAKAFKQLESIIKDAEYASANKAALEEDVYALSALQVSMMHKNAGSQSDMESAVSVLNYVLNAVKNDNNKQILSGELRRYQKKLFGGYKYV